MPHDVSSACLSAYVVLLNDEGKVFMMRRANAAWMNGFYNLPAGKVERHETFQQAAIRETKEEVGVTVHSDDLELFLVQSRYCGAQAKQPDWVDMFFVAKKWSGTPAIAEPHKFDQAGWHAPDEASIPVVPNIRDALTHLGAQWPAFSVFHEEEYAARGAA
jgi:8-oxo-dGTP diphosphatase